MHGFADFSEDISADISADLSADTSTDLSCTSAPCGVLLCASLLANGHVHSYGGPCWQSCRTDFFNFSVTNFRRTSVEVHCESA